jgi:molybdate transport system substrate-binding protein
MSDAADTPEPPTPTVHPRSGELTVFAASSLIDVFNEMAVAFQTRYPDTNVVFNFAGTPTLRTQLEQGAQAEIFASANQEQMELALRSGVVTGEPATFATNRLVVLAPAGRESVQALGDLEKPGVKIVLALPNVPVGDYSRQSLQKMDASREFPAGFANRVLSNVVSEESNVRQVLAKVALGEADAGIAYGTDVTPDVMDQVRIIEIPDEFNVLAVYPIAQVKSAPTLTGSTAFIEFILSADGQEILARYGFGGVSP